MSTPPPSPMRPSADTFKLGNNSNIELLTREVVLRRDPNDKMGMALAESDCWGLGVRICDLERGGVAWRTGQIFDGDVLLSINDVGYLHASLHDVEQAFKSAFISSPSVKIKLCSGEEMDANVPLVKRPVVIGTAPLRTAIRYIEKDDGIFIAEVDSTLGTAEQTDVLYTPHVDDKIISVDNTSLTQIDSEAIATLLTPISRSFLGTTAAGGTSSVTLLLERRVSSANRASVGHSNADRTIEIKRGNGPLGLRLVSSPGGLGIRVLRVVPGTTAFDAGSIRSGDWISRCNGIDISEMNFVDSVELIKSADLLRLMLVADMSPIVMPPEDAQERRIIELTSHEEASRMRTAKTKDGHLVISELPLHHNPELNVGDTILTINGQDTQRMGQPSRLVPAPRLILVTQPQTNGEYGLVHQRLHVAPEAPSKHSLDLSFDTYSRLIRVEGVPSGSSLHRAGLAVGVALLQVNNIDLRRPEEPDTELENALKILNSVKGQNYSLTVAEWPHISAAADEAETDTSKPHSVVLLGHTVSLYQNASGFGLEIDIDENSCGARIIFVDPKGPNANNSNISIGDVILEISGISIMSASVDEICKLFAPGEGTVDVVVAPGNVVDTLDRAVTIKRDGDGFGMNLCFDMICCNGKPINFPRVVDITPSGPAESCGQVFVGDRVLACNEISLEKLAEGDVIDMFCRSDTIEVTLRTDHSPLLSSSSPHIVVLEAPNRTSVLTVSSGRSGIGAYVADEGVNKHVKISSGFIRAGEKIVEINGICVESCTVTEVMDLLRGDVKYTIELFPVAKKKHVELQKSSSMGFGMKLFAELDGIHELRISEVIDGSPAELSGKIFTGDVITSINDTLTCDLGHKEAIEMLIQNQRVTLTLEESQTTLPVENPSHRGVCIRKFDGDYPIAIHSKTGKGASIRSVDFEKDSTYSRYINTGDLILQINGIDVTKLPIEQIKDMLAKTDSAILTLAIDRPALTVMDEEIDASTSQFH